MTTESIAPGQFKVHKLSPRRPGDRDNVIAHLEFAFAPDEWDDSVKVTELSAEVDGRGIPLEDDEGKKTWKNSIVASIHGAGMIRVKDAQILSLNTGAYMLKVPNLLIPRELSDRVLAELTVAIADVAERGVEIPF